MPAWVAEMDYARRRAGHGCAAGGGRARRGRLPGVRAVRRPDRRGVRRVRASATSGPACRPDRVLPTADVTVGVRIALEVLSEPAPMVLPLPAYDPQHGLAPDHRPRAVGPARGPGRRQLRRRPRRARPAVRAWRADAAAHPAAQPRRPRAHPRRARGDPRRRDAARRPRGQRRDPRPAGAAGRRARALPVPGGHRRPRGRGRRGVQGVQHPRAQVRADPHRRRRDPRPAGRDPDGAERLVGLARRRGLGRGVHRRRPVAGRAGRTARPAAHPPAASCSPSTCPRRGCGRSRRRTWSGWTCAPTATTTRPTSSAAVASGSRPGRSTGRGSPATSGSTSPPHPTG